MMMGLMNYKKYQKTNERGAALILSLGVLALITVVAVGYTTLMRFEEKASRNTVYYVQTDQIAKAALNYSIAVLLKDLADDEAGGPLSMRDSYDEEWVTTFSSTNVSDPDLDGNSFSNSNWRYSKWIYVHENSNGSGKVIGRFAVLIQDEAGKININTAGPSAQNEGWSTYEIDLEQIPGIGVTLADDIELYREGGTGSRVPGADIADPGPHFFGDDNNNNSALTNDGIDNDADGSTDEMNEGISNDPTEFDPEFPYFDDRPFTSVEELVKINGIGGNIVAALKNYATVWSYDVNKYRVGSGSWARKININHLLSASQLYELNLHTTDEKYRMAANIIDYADMDHYPTFTTTDSATPNSSNSYVGTEGLQFNEIMSDVGNIARQNDEDNPGTNNDVVRSGTWSFNPGTDTGTDGQVANYTWPWDNGIYDITIAASTDGGVLGGMTWELEPGEPGAQTGSLNAPVTVTNVHISGGAINLRLTAAADNPDPLVTPDPGVSYFDFIDVRAGKYIEIINISKKDILINKNGGNSWKLNVGGTLTPPAQDGQPFTISGGTDFELSQALNNSSNTVQMDGYTNGFPPSYDYLILTDSLYAIDAIHRNDTGSWNDGGGEAGTVLSIPLSVALANLHTTLTSAGADLALVDSQNRVLAFIPVSNSFHITGYGASVGGGQSIQRVSPVDQTAAWVYKVNTPSIPNDYNPNPDPNSDTGNNKYWGIKDSAYASIGEITDAYTGTSSAGTFDIESHGEDYLYQLTVSERRLEAEDEDDTTHHSWSTETGHDGTTRYVANSNSGTWTWTWSWDFTTDAGVSKPFRLRENLSYDVLVVGEFGSDMEIPSGTDFYMRPDNSAGISNVGVSSESISIQIGGNNVDTPKLDYIILTPEPYTWGKININTAPLEVLKGLPGVDDGLASNIINYRASNVFDQIEEFTDVSGVGEETFKPISNLITVRSDNYRIIIRAERLVDVDGNGAEDDITDVSVSTVNVEAVVDRNPQQRFGGSDNYRLESLKVNYE